MKNIIYFFLLTLIIKSQPISENLAFRKVMENLKGSIPESYVRQAFAHKDLKIHKIHYKGSSLFLLALLVISFMIYVFRGFMK